MYYYYYVHLYSYSCMCSILLFENIVHYCLLFSLFLSAFLIQPASQIIYMQDAYSRSRKNNGSFASQLHTRIAAGSQTPSPLSLFTHCSVISMRSLWRKREKKGVIGSLLDPFLYCCSYIEVSGNVFCRRLKSLVQISDCFLESSSKLKIIQWVFFLSLTFPLQSKLKALKGVKQCKPLLLKIFLSVQREIARERLCHLNVFHSKKVL